MKTKKLPTILLIVFFSIAVLCCFSYGQSNAAPNSLSFEQGFTVFGKAGSFDSKERSFFIEDAGKTFSVVIPSDARIIIDGHLGSFEKIELISAYRDITASCMGGSYKTIYIQTVPQVFSGEIRSIDINGDNSVLGADVNSLRMYFYMDSFPDDIKTGDHIRFLPDGSKIIEVVKE